MVLNQVFVHSPHAAHRAYFELDDLSFVEALHQRGGAAPATEDNPLQLVKGDVLLCRVGCVTSTRGYLEEHVIEHILDLLAEVRHRKLEEIEVPWQVEGMYHLLVVLDVEAVPHDLNNGALIFVHVAVVGSAEDRDDARKLVGLLPIVDLIPLNLDLMRSDDQSEIVLIQQFFSRCESIFEGALPFRVFYEVDLISDLVLNRIRPKDIA